MAPFFKTTLESNFEEAAEVKIRIYEDIPATIKRFRLWAYTGSILADDEDIQNRGWRELIQLYIFAERYDIVDLQNSVIDSFVAKEQACLQIPVKHLSLIYSNTRITSPLRRLMVDLCAQKGKLDVWFAPESPKVDSTTIPPAFMVDLAVAQYRLMEKKAQYLNWCNLGCMFHVHPSATTKSEQQTNGGN